MKGPLMMRLANKAVVYLGSMCLLVAICDSASAQRRGGARLFGAIPAVSLAQLEEVQQELKLTDEQKQKVAQLNQELNEARREAFQNAAGDFDKIREDVSKLYRESTAKFTMPPWRSLSRNACRRSSSRSTVRSC